MDAEIKRKWIEALRSGKYAQGRGSLRVGENAYCCLGVLCDLVDGSRWARTDRGFFQYGPSTSLAPPTVSVGTGLQAGSQLDLINLNDSGKSFPEIADYIEANL